MVLTTLWTMTALGGPTEPRVQPLFDAAHEMLASSDFADRLTDLQTKLLAGPYESRSYSGAELVQLLRGGATLVPSGATISAVLRPRVPADTDLSVTPARIRLNGYVLNDRWERSSWGKACALNTMVHELMHTPVDQEGNQLFTDTGHEGSGLPLVTYVAGSVAQCTYWERIRGQEMGTERFQKCVEATSHREDGWGRTFIWQTCQRDLFPVNHD